MLVYKFWRFRNGLAIPTEITEANDAELAEIVAAGTRCADCGGSHPDMAEQAGIIKIARARGWPTQAVT